MSRHWHRVSRPIQKLAAGMYTGAGESSLSTGRVVQAGIKKIKIIYNEPGKQREDQYGGDPSEDVGSPFPPVIDQQPIHVSPYYPTAARRSPRA